MSLKWTKCCKGRKCPEIALEGELVHIKDDYGNQVAVHRDQFPLFQEPADSETNPQTVRIHGKESGKPPVRMTLVQFYEMLGTVDGLRE